MVVATLSSAHKTYYNTGVCNLVGRFGDASRIPVKHHQAGYNTVKDIYHYATIFNMIQIMSLGLGGERQSCRGSLPCACFTAVRMFDPVVYVPGVLPTLLIALVSIGKFTELSRERQRTSQLSAFREGMMILGRDI